MSRRRMMIAEKKMVNLFDKNSGDIVWNARLNQDGTTYTGDENAKITFVSGMIKVSPNDTYVLIRDLISNINMVYNRWCIYNEKKLGVSYSGSKIKENFITIPENGYYIRFNGLITDIDNVKFYKK